MLFMKYAPLSRPYTHRPGLSGCQQGRVIVRHLRTTHTTTWPHKQAQWVPDCRDVNMNALCIEELLMLGVCAIIYAHTLTKKKSMGAGLAEKKGELFPRNHSQFGGARRKVSTHAQATGAAGRDFQAPTEFYPSTGQDHAG